MNFFKPNSVSSAVLIFAISIGVASAQNTKVDRATKQIGEAAETLNTLKGLFGKKKKVNDSVATKTSGQAVASGEKLAANIHYAGKITPQTKYIDCDELYPFSKGAAIVKKGNVYGLINQQAELIVPFNKYASINDISEGKWTGIFSVSFHNSLGHGYINYKGKEIVTPDMNAAHFTATGDGKFLISYKENSTYTAASITILDVEGKRVDLAINGTMDSKYNMQHVADSVIVYRVVKNNKSLYGFKNFDGSGIAPKFDQLSAFSNGIAGFGSVNEFGELKFGLINRKGEVIFPAKLTSLPYQFQDGIVFLPAGKGADFESALMNTKGEIIYKNTKESQAKYGQFVTFNSAFAYGGLCMLDKKGKIYNQLAFLKNLGLSIGPNGKFQTGYFVPHQRQFGTDNYQRFTVATGTGIMGHTEFNGLYDSIKGDVILCLLSQNNGGVNHLNWNGRNTLVLFDDQSGLAHVTLQGTEKDRNNKFIGIDGYINKRGEFAIIRAPKKSDW